MSLCYIYELIFYIRKEYVMSREKINFYHGQNCLAGLLEKPDSEIKAYALFAHCFTCGKDVAAASRISRALTSLGYAVLRFDFTGLGASEGEFSNTNFSSNVGDLIAAANYLRTHYQAPSLIIGHSLGGRAVLSAARHIPELRAVVTIAAPADAAHIRKQFSNNIVDIEQKGEAEVSLAGRVFTIKKQFLDDISQNNEDIENLNIPLLILHSPQDTVVSIGQAEIIYKRAKHPKSFVSLDTANHLLSNKKDAHYAATVIAAWVERYIPQSDTSTQKSPVVSKGSVWVGEGNHRFTRHVHSDTHQWLADEPIGMGDDLGPDPYEHLLAALGTCTSMTLRMFANRNHIPLDDVQVLLHHRREYGEDCQYCDKEQTQVDILDRKLIFKGILSEEQQALLLKIADRCPVHKTLENKIVIETQLLSDDYFTD